VVGSTIALLLITLKKEPADAVHKLINNLQEIVQLFSAYPECKLIFLEVPVFSPPCNIVLNREPAVIANVPSFTMNNYDMSHMY
jgi:glutathione peroxidase-family protein